MLFSSFDYGSFQRFANPKATLKHIIPLFHAVLQKDGTSTLQWSAARDRTDKSRQNVRKTALGKDNLVERRASPKKPGAEQFL